MRDHPIRYRVAAFLLLLIFSLKIGVGLCLHNIFHGASAKSLSGEQKEIRSPGFDCSCKDDLSLPFVHQGFPEIAAPNEACLLQATLLCTAFHSQIPLSFFLRGPPAGMA